LGDIENVKKALEQLHGIDPNVRKLHSLLFGAPGTKMNRKKNIRSFSGFDPERKTDEHDKKLDQLQKYSGEQLKFFASLLDVEKTGTHDELAQRLLDFLYKPKDSGREYKFSGAKKGTKRKASTTRKSSKKGKKDKDDKPKRGPSAYILFCSDHRAEIKKKHPKFTFAETAKHLGEMWSNLSDKKKGDYQTLAKKAKPGDGKKSKSKSKSKKKSAAADESGSGSGTESDNEGGGGGGSGSASEGGSGSGSSSDEGKAKKKKSKSPAKKKSPKKSPKKSKSKSPAKSKKKAADKTDDSGSEEGDDSAASAGPKKKKAKTEKEKKVAPDEKVQAAVKKMVETGDLEKISVKSIKGDLKNMFSEAVVSAQKKNIKAWITLYLAECNARDEKAGKGKKTTNKKGDKGQE